MLRVAVLGAGTVGREVVRAFETFPERLAVQGGPALTLVGVGVRDLSKALTGGIDPELLTDAPAHLIASPQTDVVVELMGGEEPARTFIAAALGAGRAVVTANKHVIAHHGPELEAVARRTGAALRFEAAVAGGIPILGPLAADLAANRVTRVRGIVNGSTNYLLTAMAGGGRAYADVLAEAQAAGYLEADPSADVEGGDAVNKLVILIRLAFGVWVDPEAIVRRPPTVGGQSPSRPNRGSDPKTVSASSWIGAPGITGVTLRHVAGAAALGFAIKLVADARRLPDGRLAASVVPTAVPLDDPLGRTDGVTNRVEVHAEPIGMIAASGPGAGGAATSSAVLGDLLAIARGAGSTWAGLPAAGAATPGDLAGPAESAPDRGWFAVVPEAADAALSAASGLARSRVRLANFEDGTAVHLAHASLSEMRTLLAAAGVAADLLVLPVDEGPSEV